MLILTQDRSEIVNLDRYDQIYIRPSQSIYGDPVDLLVAIRSGIENDDLEEAVLGVFSERDEAIAVLSNIACDARDGKEAYIIEKGF